MLGRSRSTSRLILFWFSGSLPLLFYSENGGRNGCERKSVGMLPFRIFIVPLHRNLARSIAWFAFLGWGCSSKWIVPWCNGNTSDSGSEIEDSNSSGTTWADSKRRGWCRYTSLWGCSPSYYNVASFLPWVRCVFFVFLKMKGLWVLFLTRWSSSFAHISVSSRKCANFADEKTKLLKNKSSWQVQRKL